MQTNAQQIDAEPGEAGDDVADDRQIHDAAVADDSTPTRVENDCVPRNDEERAIFFRVPTPKAAPGLIGPDTAEDGASETEECCETDSAVNHLVAAKCKMWRYQHRHKTRKSGDDVANAKPVNAFQNDSEKRRAPADKNGRGVKIGNRRPAFEDHPENKAKRVKAPGQDDYVKSRAPQRFRRIGSERQGQQGNARYDQGEYVHYDTMEERLDVVVVRFSLPFLEF